MSKYELDSFCFYWASMHAYVLVRVLDATIALYPLPSRLGFLHFHHHHALTLDIEGWHGRCQVADGGHQHLILSTQHATFQLTARSIQEKKMFLNLVKLKQGIQQPIDTEESDIVASDILDQLQKRNAGYLELIQHQIERLERAKQQLSGDIHQLALLEQSLDGLIESVPLMTTVDGLSVVKGQLGRAVQEFHLHLSTVATLVERVSVHHDFFLEEARRKYEVVKKRVVSHAWSPMVAVLVGVMAVVWYCRMVWV